MPSYRFASIGNNQQLPAYQTDSQESFVLAETLKYYYLLVRCRCEIFVRCLTPRNSSLRRILFRWTISYSTPKLIPSTFLVETLSRPTRHRGRSGQDSRHYQRRPHVILSPVEERAVPFNDGLEYSKPPSSLTPSRREIICG